MPSRRKQITYSQRPTHTARSVHARGERRFITYDTSYIRPKKSKAPVILAVILAVALIGALGWGLSVLFSSCSASHTELLAEGEEAVVVVEEGASASAIAQHLVDARLIPSMGDFTKRVKELNVATQFKPGTYTFMGGVSIDSVIDALKAGPAMGNTLLIPEGFRLSEIAGAVSEATDGRISAEEFISAASDASVYADKFAFLADVGTNSLEGFLFPKTYEVSKDATADSLIIMMLTQFQSETANLDWSYARSQGLTFYDAVKLASIVEKESSGDEKIRAQVAAVFYNRLGTSGEPAYGFLQSDATTVYEVGQNPTSEQVHAQTPYSTYTNKGLPPTPICSPGLDCLQAVCAPDKDALGTYFFFYFDDEGNYFFTETYEDHIRTFS